MYAIVAVMLTMGPPPEWLVDATVAVSPLSPAGAEDILNVVAVIPLGVLLPLAFGWMTLWRTTVAITAASIAVEMIQAFLDRSPQLSDVAFNTFGGVIGTILVALFTRSRRG